VGVFACAVAAADGEDVAGGEGADWEQPSKSPSSTTSPSRMVQTYHPRCAQVVGRYPPMAIQLALSGVEFIEQTRCRTLAHILL